MEKNMKKNVYTYNWTTLLYTRKYSDSTESQPLDDQGIPNKKLFKKLF